MITYTLLYLIIGFLLAVYVAYLNEDADDISKGLLGISCVFFWPVITFMSIVLIVVILFGIVLDKIINWNKKWK